MKIVFTSPTRLHSESEYYSNSSDKTISDVALELEDKYKIINEFEKSKIDDIKNIIVKEKINKFFNKDSNENLGKRLDFLWGEYILNEGHGFQSKRARKTGGVTFVDTGDYYNTMEITTEMTIE